MFLRKVVVVAITAAVFALPAAGAFAASGSTTLTVPLTGGTLSISAPASASLAAASVAPGSTSTGSLGSTTVTDNRGTLAGWSVTVLASGNLVDGSGDVITLTAASSTLTWATGAVSASGSSVLSGVSAGAGGLVSTNVAAAAVTAVSLFGGGTFTFNPSLSFVVPANVKAGSYTTTVVQTVA
jgi:hypothetical protein